MKGQQRRSDIIKCPVHTAIKEECLARLRAVGAFSKDDVLEITRMEAVADSIRWDYLRDLIADELKTKLLPVAARFFHQKSSKHNPNGWTLDANPGAFLATGWGKKTAGFVSVELKNGALVIKNFQDVVARARGARGAVHVLEQTATDHGFSLDPVNGAIALPAARQA
jgi:hypothetical protein